MPHRLFEIVRENCSAETWSKAVELARRDTVTGDALSTKELRFRVLNRDSGVSPTVLLWPEDEDWHCDCGSANDPCEHTAACLIALKQAKAQGKALPSSKRAHGKLTYHFIEDEGFLSFVRKVELTGGGEEELMAPLSAITSGRLSGPPLTATKDDMAVEVALGNERRGRLSAATFAKILPPLSLMEGLYCNGSPIQASTLALGWQVLLEDNGPTVNLSFRPHPRINAVYKNGVCRSEEAIHLLGKAPPAHVREGKQTFGRQQFDALVSEVLPKLACDYEIVDLSTQLPKVKEVGARLELELTPVAGDSLQVTPLIVYGDPPLATVKAGQFKTHGKVVPTRDKDEERQLQDLLSRKTGFDLNRSFILPRNEAMDLVKRLAGERIACRGKGLSAFKVYGTLVPHIAVNDAGLGLSFTLGEEKIPWAAVQKAWEEKSSYVKLTTDGYGELPAVFLEKHALRLAEVFGSEDKSSITTPSTLLRVKELSDDLGVAIPETWRLKIADLTRDTPPAELPVDFNGTLRAYQEAGFQWLNRLSSLGWGALLADDMGLGKTIQTIATLKAPALIVCPTSVLPNWQKEIERFRPGLTVNLYHGAKRQLSAAAITLTSYGILRLDGETLGRQAWQTVVIDEAQQIKNPTSQIAQAVYAFAAAPRRIALTGTPVENSLDDLWSLFRFLNPGLFGPLATFQKLYARSPDSQALERLQKRIKPFYLRRLKQAVALELPPKTEQTLYAELSESEGELYQTIWFATQKEVQEKLKNLGSYSEILEALLRLRQAACHPSLVPGQNAPTSAKVELLLDNLKVLQASNNKALVFSQWTSFLDLIGKALAAEGIPYLRLDGATRDREQVVRRFQDEEQEKVLLISLKAGGVGLNLTRADHVFIMDPWWNPAVEAQAQDRAYRIGQTNPVMVYRVIAKGTVEEKILNLQDHKRQIADDLVSAGDSLSLSKQDLAQLLMD